jgi:hypothetical protein
MSPSFEANYSAPPTIPLFVGDGHLLSDVAVARLTSLRQRTSDLHSAIPSLEDIKALSDQKQDHRNRISQLRKPRSQGGFGQPELAPEVVSATRQ